MAELKSVAKDTAIYGLSSIIGKFLNYLLVPLYTAKMTVESGGYGIVTNIYAYVALLMVILTFGMETTLFRFANKEGENPQTVYGTTLTMVGSLSLLFALLVLAFLHPIASGIGYADHPEYVGIMAITVALDAFQAIPFAWLRYQHRPIKFFALKMLFIVLNITLNILYFVVLPALYVRHAWVGAIYDPSVGPGYAFILNLVCTSFITFFFIPELTGFKYRFDTRLMKRMLGYSWPILILGIAGILNQTADKIIFPLVYGAAEAAKSELGIYGACVKIAMIMAMITQAFRYAYEPFVFGKQKEGDNRRMYAQAMKYFLIFAMFAFLVVMFYLDLLRYMVAPDYWAGLSVVAIVIGAEIFKGIYFNLSFWYKLIDETRWGAYFSIVGCVIIVGMNVMLVPTYGFVASAWASVAGYAVITILSYWIGQKKYPIHYDLKHLGTYVLFTAVLYVIGEWVPIENIVLRLAFRTVLLLIFMAYVVRKDLPLSQIPVINRIIKKK